MQPPATSLDDFCCFYCKLPFVLQSLRHSLPPCWKISAHFVSRLWRKKACWACTKHKMPLSPFCWEQSKPLAVPFLLILSGQRVDFSLSHIPVGSFKRCFEDEVVFPKKPAILSVSQNCLRTKRGHVCWWDAHCETWFLWPLLSLNSTNGFHNIPSYCYVFFFCR